MSVAARVITPGIYHFGFAMWRAKEAEFGPCEVLGNMSQPLILRDEQCGLLTHIAATEGVSLCVRMKS